MYCMPIVVSIFKYSITLSYYFFIYSDIRILWRQINIYLFIYQHKKNFLDPAPDFCKA